MGGRCAAGLDALGDDAIDDARGVDEIGKGVIPGHSGVCPDHMRRVI